MTLTIKLLLFGAVGTAILARSVHVAVYTYTGPNGAFNGDVWNAAINWDGGSVPSGTADVEIPAGKSPGAVKSAPAYTGNLTLKNNSALGIGATAAKNTANALGTGTITMESGPKVIMRYGAAYTLGLAASC